jgi:phosphonate transport system permease protein
VSTTTTPRIQSAQTRPNKPRNVVLQVGVLVVALAVVWAFRTADLPMDRLVRAPGRILDIARLMFFWPDLSNLGRSMAAMVESVQMAWLGTMLAAVLSLPLSLLAAKNVTGRVGSGATRQVLNGIRAFPELVLAVLLLTVFGPNAVTGTLALGLHSIGTLGKLSSEAVESIDRGPIEAVDAVGGTWLQRMRWAVLPQSMPEIVSFWLYRFEINIRASAILGAVGAGGIGSVLSDTLVYKEFGQAGTAFLVVVVVTLGIDAVSSRIRARIIAGAPGAVATEAEAVANADV